MPFTHVLAANFETTTSSAAQSPPATCLRACPPAVQPANTAPTRNTVPAPVVVSTEPATEDTEVLVESAGPVSNNVGVNAPTVDESRNSALRDCEAQVDTLMKARVVYKPESTMFVGQNTSVEAVITFDLTTSPEVVFGTTDSPVVADAASLPCTIEAELRGLTSDFEIDPIGFRQTRLLAGNDERLTWTVKPKHTGERMLLTLYVQGILSDGARTDQSFIRGVISVKALPQTSTNDGSAPSGVFAALGLIAIAGAAILYTRRQKGLAAQRQLFAATDQVTTGTSIFVSYSRKDSKRAEEVVQDLEGVGYDVWHDTEDIRGGESWRRSIISGISAARVVVVVLSPNSLASANVERELSVAQDKHKQILPISIAPAAIPEGFQYLFAGVQIVDLTANSRAHRKQVLLREVSAFVPAPAPGAGSQPAASLPAPSLPPPTLQRPTVRAEPGPA